MINILTGIDSTSSALNAERIRMDVVSQNIANANTIHGPNGRPYARQHVVFEAVLKDKMQGPSGPRGVGSQMVQVARIESAHRPPRMVYQPGHPDADANSMVAMPNINIYEEMVDLMAASRAYEANLNVVKTARSMAMQTLAIGRR
jgi:flagellar basal-body rod protein FlgC